MSDLEKLLAAENELVKSRNKIMLLEDEVSFIRGKLPERDRQIDVLRGDLQQQATTVQRLIEERDEARKLLAEVTQERDHWLGKCKEILAMHLFIQNPGITPPLAFMRAEHFLAERDSRRKKAEVTNEN